MAMDDTTPVDKLADTVHSLIGSRAHLTSSWVNSVCDIVKSLHSHGSKADPKKPTNFENEDFPSKREEDISAETFKIKDKLSALTTYVNQLHLQRKQILNELLDLKGNIRVFCHIRPITHGEKIGCLRPLLPSDSSGVLLKLSDEKSKKYTFDKIFHPGSSQDDVFSEVEPMIKSALDGYNACIFAYGQTGTGKTFTMEGTQEFPGVVPRTIEALFKQATESNHAYLFSFSMVEIYLGNLKDLLVAQSTRPTDPLPPSLSIQTDPRGGVEIDNLVAIKVNDSKQALKLYKLGCRFRSTASTGSNMTSSRSHCMIRISISCADAPERRRETNKVWLVDLGGSERVLKTRASGRRFEEGKAINLSLSALGDVIQALQRRKCHVPYRNSKLTQVLKDSLGQDSKTLMLVHVSPKQEDICETICSLNFATKARSIHLGQDSVEQRYQKEALMFSLQKKMKNIEEARSEVVREIQKLNEKLEILTMTAPSSTKEPDASPLPTDMPNTNPADTGNKMRDLRAVSSSQLPGFMKPTICSRRKYGTDNQSSGLKKLTAPRRRRPSSRRAESIAFPLKAGSEYNSEYSVSRASCMAGMNVKPCEDDETEYSQDVSECELKTVVSLEPEIFPKSVSKKAQCHSMKNERITSKCTSTKFVKVDDWLHSHKTDRISSYNNKFKQVSDTPRPRKALVLHRKSNTELSLDGIMEINKLSMEDNVNQDIEIPIDVYRGDQSISERTSLMLPEKIVNIDFGTSSIIGLCKPDIKKMEAAEHVGDGLVIEDDECGFLSPPDIWFHEVAKLSVSKELRGKIQCSDGILQSNGECCHSLTHSDYSERLDFYTSPEAESHRQDVFRKMESEVDSGKLDAESQYTTRELKCQRALFSENTNKKNPVLQFKSSKENRKNSGMFGFLRRIIQMLWASTILGLGIKKLGFGDDFFYGLMR